MSANPDQKTNSGTWKKFAVLGGIIGLAALVYFQFGDALSLSSLAEKETQLREYQANHPVLVYALSFVVYVAITGLSLPGAAALTLLYGWYFGIVKGIVIVSFASTLGATLAFLISRYLFRDAIREKFGERLENFNKSLEKEGPFYLFTLRLIPAVPFFVINAVMGLTPIRTRTFWWVSQIGMLAGTAVYIYAGSVVPSLADLAEHGIEAIFSRERLILIAVAFTLLGTFPLVARWIMKSIARRNSTATTDSL